MTLRLPDSVCNNLRFLSVEVDSQIASLQRYLLLPSVTIARHILDRSGYAYNLKTRIHDSCLKHLANSKESDAEALKLRGVEFIATALERIAGLGRDCIVQMDDLADLKYLQVEAYGPMLERVRRGIELVEPAMQGNDTRLALKIGQLEAKLQRDYNKLLKHYIKSLKKKKHTKSRTSVLFVAHNVEQMGAALLDISESIISATLGQSLNLERYHSLQASVQKMHPDEIQPDMQIETIAETRSGSSISGISNNNAKQDGYIAIFKEGKKRKLNEERQGVKNWHQIYPGLAPKIISYKKHGPSATLLIEHLSGLTFEQILLNESQKRLQQAFKHLSRTLQSVWNETRTEKPVSARFMSQLQKRLPDVYKIHPEFHHSDSHVCGKKILAFDTLLARARDFESRLSSPFSVYIHGDFNVDNIIYEPNKKHINFIDLHRSCYMDYVQDVSVFMVSNYRLQILDKPSRQRIMRLAQDFYAMSSRYARQSGDDSFELRLALGLARSFASSTRFILDKTLARRMFLRARYLIERVLALKVQNTAAFRIPIKEIFIE
ncbi:MAG: aminoglycoside phosphotransferase family protein [gamma proteobacterium symbiont of Bathyaustriella thionipta]|nr:aminoglycoside phosphotransferase family protein [gamma proteobacterium symbiont of Bathyaustriella thionipta]